MEGPSNVVVAPAAWQMARHSVLFLFDIARISRGAGDLLEPLILTAILQANQAALNGRPELQLQYDKAEAALPDDLRRPISMNAVAQSLDLPFESVRRRVHALASRGLCVISVDGVHVPAAVVTTPGYVEVQARRISRLAALQADLMADGLLGAEAPRSFLAGSARAADRLLATYMLRACNGVVGLLGGAADGMVYLALGAANLRELRVASVSGWDSFRDLAPACTGARLAHDLGMPEETVRRRVHALEGRGFCVGAERGWVATAPPERHELLGRLAAENAQNLRRLFAALHDLARGAATDHPRSATGG